MKFEFSAGGIVFRRQPASPSLGGKTEDAAMEWLVPLGYKSQKSFDILLCQHSYHHGWGFPKGLIGDTVKGEGKKETAIREVEEETGAKGEIIRALNPITYWYQFEKEKIKKTVYYYIMKYIEGDIAIHDMEMENVEWVESKNVLSKLTFPSDKKVFQEALPIIEKLITND